MGPRAVEMPFNMKPKDFMGRLKILVYGFFGAGKTYLIGTAAKDPAFGKILLLSPDPGALTLAFDEDMNSRITVGPIKTLADLDSWYEYLRVQNPKLGDEAFQTLCIDGWTDLGDMALTESLQKVHDANASRDVDQAGIDTWGRVGVIMRRELRRFRDLPMHFISTALAKEVTNKDGAIFISPSVPGSLKSEIGAFFDIVGFLHIKREKKPNPNATEAVELLESERVLRVQPTEKILAKDRTRKLGEKVINPTLGGILSTIKSASPQGGAAEEPLLRLKKADIATK